VAAGEAATPAARISVRLAIRSSPIATPSQSHWVTGAPSLTSTPNRRKARAASL